MIMDGSGHLIIPVRYLGMKFSCHYMRGKPLWAKFEERLRQTFGMFGVTENCYLDGHGQICICSSDKTWKFLCVYAIQCEAVNMAIELELACKPAVLSSIAMEAREWISTGKPLLNKHRIAIRLFSDDILKEAIGIKVSAKRFGYRFVSYKQVKNNEKILYEKWIVLQGKKAVQMLYSSSVDDSGDRKYHDLRRSVVAVLEEIFSMSLDQRIHIGFDFPDEDTLIKDVSRFAKKALERRISRNARAKTEN